MKKILKEDFEKTYQPKLRACDVIEKTEYFKVDLEEQLQQNNKALKHYKLSFRLSTIMSIILLLGVIGLGYIHWGWDNTGKENMRLEVLTEEYCKYMRSINPYVSKDCQYVIRINNNTSMYIYKGFDADSKNIDYFYIVHFEHTKNKTITILIDSQEISIDETSCGHLAKLSLEEDKALHFTIKANGLSKEYTIAD